VLVRLRFFESDEPQIARFASALIAPVLLPPLVPLVLAFATRRVAGDVGTAGALVAWYDAVRRRAVLRTLAIRPSLDDSIGDSIGLSGGPASSVSGGLVLAGVRAVVGVPFAVDGPDGPLANGSREVVEIFEAREPERRGEPCFR